jgi:AcrR family transcriptional regulator
VAVTKPKKGASSSKGRPRSDDSTNRIRKATIKLLKEKPFFEISVDEIASASDSSKATIYRRWESLEELCADSFFFEAKELIRFDNTGSLEKDLTQGLIRFGKFLNGPWGRALRTLIGSMSLKSNAAEVIMRNYYELRWKQISEVLQRGKANGEIDRDINIDHLTDRLFGPVFYKFLIRRETINDSYCKDLVASLSLRRRAK